MTSSTEPTPPATPARYPDEDFAGLAALLEPYLRANLYTSAGADLTAMDLLVDARPREVVDALFAAGVLVDSDIADRAHLRASWAAMSTALVHLSKDQPLTPDVLAAVPLSHRFYLMGHEAAHRQLSLAWGRLLGAQEQLQRILRHGATPKPSELGAILATLGGVNPYDEDDTVRRGDPGDPWRDCWLSDDAAGGEDQGAGDQGGLPAKWQGTATAADVAAAVADFAPVLADLDAAELAEQVTKRASLLRDCLAPGDRDGAPLLDRAMLQRRLPVGAGDLLAQIPTDARAYALPWPAGTRATYDPAAVVLRETGRDRTGMTDTEVVSRTLFVEFDSGEDADRFPVGTVRRLAPHDKRRGHLRRWWECRFCKLGATGSASVAAEQAECLGHEAICPDQDKIRAVVPAGEDRFA